MRTVILICTGLITTLAGAAQEVSRLSPEQRAVAYLAREVPRWSRENHCFSCHNNGDAARALYAARRLSYSVPTDALRDTTEWLSRPLDWDNNKGEPGFSDKKLARIQFAAALAEAVRGGAVADRDPLIVAAETLLADQDTDGSWKVDPSGSIGSPATYGSVLATFVVRRTLTSAAEERFDGAIQRADAWLSAREPTATVDAAALALALRDRLSADSDWPHPAERRSVLEAKLRATLDGILENQTSDGGWGPYPKSPAEVFDTAIALLALNAAYRPGYAGSEAQAERISKGRAYLIATQLSNGGWPETTRPSGSQSYAQHISTTGWAALALLKTHSVAENGRRHR